MTHFDFEVPLYHYHITFAYITEEDYQELKANGKDKLQKDVLKLTTSEYIIDIILKDVEQGTYDGAITFHDSSEHNLFVFFYPMYSVTRPKECAFHELYHLTSDIVKKCDLDEEAGAYLQEYIGMRLLDFIHTKLIGL